MGLFGKGKTFRISGLSTCKVEINGKNISAYLNGDSVDTLEYDGLDIYANDTCISAQLRRDSRYDVTLKPGTAKSSKKAKDDSEEAEQKTVVEHVIKLDKSIEDDMLKDESSPFTLENLNIVITGSIDTIESDGNLSIKCKEVSNINCDSSCNIECEKINGDVELDSGSIKGNITGDVCFNGKGEITGNVTGSIDADDNLTISGNVNASTSDISAGGELNIAGSTIAKDISCEYNFTVKGNLNCGDIESSGDIRIGGDFNGGTINADGGVTFSK